MILLITETIAKTGLLTCKLVRIHLAFVAKLFTLKFFTHSIGTQRVKITCADLEIYILLLREIVSRF